MLFELIACVLVFFTVTLGLAWPGVDRLALDPAEKFVTTIALSLVGVYFVAGVVYALALPNGADWILVIGAGAGAAFRAREFAAMFRDADVRGLLIGQLLVTAWCLGWHALVASYQGGGWAGDWFEHWERTLFFLQHWPGSYHFLESYPLTARPPLVNLVTAAFLQLTRADFAHYQMVTTLFSSLVYLPAALLARRFGGQRAVAVTTLLLMFSPLVVQNATFPWTKLPAAFFTLAALYFFLRAHDGAPPRAAAPLCGTLLAAGLLAHYSAGPYAVALAGAWFALGWTRRHEPGWWRVTSGAALAGALVLATWFGWSLAVYGGHDTFLTNTSVTMADRVPGGQLAKIALNFRDTVVPHFMRSLDRSLIEQTSLWGQWRDWWFQLYQLNLFFAFGSAGWLALIAALVHAGRVASRRDRFFWGAFVLITLGLGIAVQGPRDTWGLVPICLQPLVVLGLAFLASRWATLHRSWKLILLAGATFDFAVGIALHFAVQDFFFDRWPAPDHSPLVQLGSYAPAAGINLVAKITKGLQFFGDALPSLPIVGLLAIVFLFALRETRRSRPPRLTTQVARDAR